MHLTKVISTAQAVELTQQEMQFIKDNNLKHADQNNHDIAAIHKRYSSERTLQHHTGWQGRQQI